ncbi:ornithine cyclodeaminase family protein [Halobacteriales archaeon QS_4_66_20]|nr:MAG: ornithine cyclodeaminase family protein [Halobacteriales archaeon QS_4_66_20]
MAGATEFDGTRIISESCVRRIGDVAEAVDAVEEAFCRYAAGEATMPPKSYVDLADVDGDFRSMPARVGDGAGVKWVNVHPDNPERFGLPTVMGLVVYSDPESAYPLAVLDGTELTRLRTGAAAGVATRHLAPADASTLGIVGAGEQARTQLAAVATVRDIERVVVTDLDDAAVTAFVDHAAEAGFDAQRGSPQDVAACEIVSTTTPSREPILEAGWIPGGTHVNAMGADAAGKQELDPALLERAAVVIDDWEQCAHSGEINVPVAREGFTREDVAAEIGDVVAGETDGLRPRTTVFDSTGLAIQDIATARRLYETAVEDGEGDLVEIVGG